MKAWQVREPGAQLRSALAYVDLPVPQPAPDELLVRVRTCGVCRTDLHVAQGELAPHRPRVVPGHEVVGEVAEVGAGADGTRAAEVGAGEAGAGQADGAGFQVGDRVGVAWLRRTCGQCPYCTPGQENLCPFSTYTGWDADGGYAQYLTVPARFAYRLPDGYDDEELAPLLCAGIIGYRALRRAELPPGGQLGIYGFGASAHLTAQVAMAQGATVHVLTRSAPAQELARSLGAASVAGAYDQPPRPLDAAILFAPVGDLVPVALAALDRGGTLSVAGIHLSDIPSLNYQRHLFQERTLRSVTANTREDGAAFLALAGQHRLNVTTTGYPLAEAATALEDLAADRVNGAAVLHCS